MLHLEVLRAVRRQLDQADRWMAFAQEARALYGWTCTEESALSRVSHWCSPELRRHFPASALPLLIEVTGLDYVTPLLQLAHLAAVQRAGPLRSESEPALERRRRR